MRLPKFEHLAPKTLDEACNMLAQNKGKAKLNAGGTDILVSMKQRVKTPEYLINLKGIPGLNYINFDAKDGLKVGCLITHRDIMNSSIVKEKYPMLAHASAEVGATQIQYMGTIGGNLCLDTRCWYYNQSHWWRKSREACFKLGGNLCHVVLGGADCYAAYQGDTAPAFIALGAKVKLVKKGTERTIALADLYTQDGKKPQAIEDDEILTEIQVPVPQKKSGAHYEKLRLRGAIDFPLVAAAVSLTLTDGKCQDAKVVINAVGSGPKEISKAANALKGKEITDEVIQEAMEAAYTEAHPVKNMTSSPTYRKKMVRIMVKRAANKALEMAKKG